MMMGLICAKTVSLGAWAPFVVSRARYAQSTVRRFSRWLNNHRIKSQPLYGPLIEQALIGWVGKQVYIALDTSMLWNTYCMIRLSFIYRGRAIPLTWKVIEHGSAVVSFDVYQDLLEEYDLRFEIEVNFLDDKSDGFQLEDSLIRSAEALERLCFVLAITTLYLVSLGTAVVKQGKRRLVDPHWFRGASYLKIG
jgi:hypothetical protein